jgi:antitoxin component YwqK of YwqJK toxin-antitoxin module
VVPRIYGKVRGQYLAFYPGGNLKEEGKLDDSVRVGRWREFHEFGTGGRLKKEWKNRKDKFDEAEPILMLERDNQGKILFQQSQKFD